ncbi:ABC transporter substrate-binding protein [Rhizobium tubonense]|uniref:sn-glycerol-3-phosphate-binding periplasmic protein UgpB n=1 Tax=Rhizobium tubonense TaxID=484088 RepID=A0A2W4CQX2_9HYPH|nr:ABC transporter substrate-binding protein [Rhizobium tubonense]PZM14721.1 ABC transporter substrate-binding protein [Rhizobium tubonense]
MPLHSKIMMGVFAALLSTTSMAFAEDKVISFIQCGDSVDPTYPPFIAKWESANPGYKVNIEPVGWDQCQDKVTTLAAAGTPPSLAYVGSRTLKQFASNDLIIPVPMSDADKAAYYPNIPETVTFEGKQWGVPVAFSTKSFYWNKDLFKQAGLDPEKPPTTWAEELADAKIIKEKTGIAGFGVVAKTYDNTMHQYLHWVYTNNGKVIDADGKIVLDSPENLEALTALKAMVPYAEEGPTAYEQNEVRAIFLDGKIGMIHASVGAVNKLKDAKFKWGVANLPLGPHAKGPGTLLITDSLAIFKGTGMEDKATDLAKFLTNPENQFVYEVSNGLTPLRPVPGVKDLVAKDPSWQPFLDGISFGGPEPLFLDYKGFQNTMIDMVQSVVTGKAEPADALKKASADLEQYK